MPVTHPFVSAVSDGADTTLVRPSNWNADHAFPDKNVRVEAPGSVSILTTGILQQPLRLTLVSTDRMTQAGTGRMILTDSFSDPSVLRYRAPGSTTIMPDEFTLNSERVDLRGDARKNIVGTGRSIISDFRPGSRLVLSGRG